MSPSGRLVRTLSGERVVAPHRREHVYQIVERNVPPPPQIFRWSGVMEVVHERCCGLDVHKDKIVACLLLPAGAGGRAKREQRTFGAFTQDLLALGDWLGEHGCTHIAMESTGSYWKPV